MQVSCPRFCSTAEVTRVTPAHCGPSEQTPRKRKATPVHTPGFTVNPEPSEELWEAQGGSVSWGLTQFLNGLMELQTPQFKITETAELEKKDLTKGLCQQEGHWMMPQLCPVSSTHTKRWWLPHSLDTVGEDWPPLPSLWVSQWHTGPQGTSCPRLGTGLSTQLYFRDSRGSQHTQQRTQVWVHPRSLSDDLDYWRSVGMGSRGADL
jgi:hypothetical protein